MANCNKIWVLGSKIMANDDKENQAPNSEAIKTKIESHLQKLIQLMNNQTALIKQTKLYRADLTDKINLFYEICAKLKGSSELKDHTTQENFVKLSKEINELTQTLNTNIEKLNINFDQFEIIEDQVADSLSKYATLTSTKESDALKAELFDKYKIEQYDLSSFIRYETVPFPDLQTIAKNAAKGITKMPKGKETPVSLEINQVEDIFSAENQNDSVTTIEQNIKDNIEAIIALDKNHKALMIRARTYHQQLTEKMHIFYEASKEIHAKMESNDNHVVKNKDNIMQKLIELGDEINDLHHTLNKTILQLNDNTDTYDNLDEKGSELLEKHAELASDTEVQTLIANLTKQFKPAQINTKDFIHYDPLPAPDLKKLAKNAAKGIKKMPEAMDSLTPLTEEDFHAVFVKQANLKAKPTKKQNAVTHLKSALKKPSTAPKQKKQVQFKDVELQTNSLGTIVTHTHGTLADLKAYLKKEENREACGVRGYKEYSNQNQHGLEIQMQGTANQVNRVYAYETKDETLRYAIKKIPSEDKDQIIENICKMAVESAQPGAIFDLSNTADNKKQLVYEKLSLAIEQAQNSHQFEKEELPRITGYIKPPRP